MNKKSCIILAALSAAMLGAFWHISCGISAFADVDLGDSRNNTHTKEDICQAVSLAAHEFSSYSGCIMTKLSYSEEMSQMERSSASNGITENFDDIIVLNSTFTTSKIFSGQEWDGITQDSWKWIIVHTADKGWHYYGCGRG